MNTTELLKLAKLYLQFETKRALQVSKAVQPPCITTHYQIVYKIQQHPIHLNLHRDTDKPYSTNRG